MGSANFRLHPFLLEGAYEEEADREAIGDAQGDA